MKGIKPSPKGVVPSKSNRARFISRSVEHSLAFGPGEFEAHREATLAPRSARCRGLGCSRQAVVIDRPKTMVARRIFLARHGNRQDFVDPAWAASAVEPYDPPLSADGVDQARGLGLRLENEGITSIVASPFLRTIQTAHHANEALQVPIYLEPGFGEFLAERGFKRMPRLRGLEALRAEYPTLGEGYVAAWEQRYPETTEQLIERTQRTLTGLLDSLPGTLLVVSHAASVCAMALIDPAIESVECPLCALFCLEHDDSRWRLSLDCEVTHVGGRLGTYRFP